MGLISLIFVKGIYMKHYFIKFSYILLLSATPSFAFSNEVNIAKLQRSLNHFGFISGDVDGKFGRNTQKALEEYFNFFGRKDYNNFDQSDYQVLSECYDQSIQSNDYTLEHYRRRLLLCHGYENWETVNVSEIIEERSDYDSYYRYRFMKDLCFEVGDRVYSYDDVERGWNSLGISLSQDLLDRAERQFEKDVSELGSRLGQIDFYTCSKYDTQFKSQGYLDFSEDIHK